MFVVPRDVPRQDCGGIDYSGTAALSTGLLALLLALDWALNLGWTAPLILFLFALAAVALVGFLFIERHAGESALVPHSVMQNRGIPRRRNRAPCWPRPSSSPRCFTCRSSCRGSSASPPSAPAQACCPMMGTFMITSFIAGRLYQLLGPKIIVTPGRAAARALA